MSRWILILCCCGAVLVAAGCGGSSSTRLSEPAFRSHANSICSDLTRQEKADAASPSKAGLDRNLGRIDSALSELDRLHPPATDEQRYRDLLTKFKQSDAFVKAHEQRLIELAQKAKSDPSTGAELGRLVRPYLQTLQRAGADASALGLGACAQGLSGSAGSQSP